MDREDAHRGKGGCQEITLRNSSASGFIIGQSSAPSTPGRRTVRRKRQWKETMVGLPAPASAGLEIGVEIAPVALVEIGYEAMSPSEALRSHQQTIQKLQAELEEERSAAASAANEAMLMIVRLQQEKAEAQLEVRQFRTLTDEKMAHVMEEIAVLEDQLFKREQAVQALTCEVQAYRHRLISVGVGVDCDVLMATPYDTPRIPDTATSVRVIPEFDHPPDYPPLRCVGDVVVPDLDKYSPGESPCKLDTGFFQHDGGIPGGPASCNVAEKAIVMGHSPHALPKHARNFSYASSYASGLDCNIDEEFPADANRALDYDDMNDRVCTVDAVHGASEDYVSTPRELQNYRRLAAPGVHNVEIRKLYMWLRALEADRESMRQTLISMGIDKAQMMLSKNLPKKTFEGAPSENNQIVKKSSSRGFSLMLIIKTIFSFVFWRSNKKPDRVKFTFGLSSANAGLRLEKYPQLQCQRLLTGTQWGAGEGGTSGGGTSSGTSSGGGAF